MDSILSALFVVCLFLILASMVKSWMDGKGLLGIILHLPLLVLLGYLSYTVWKDGNRIAQLQTDLERNKEREKDLTLKKDLEKVEAEKARLETVVRELEAANKRVEKEIEDLKRDYEAKKKSIARIDTWDDYWNHVGSGSGNGSPSGTPPNH